MVVASANDETADLVIVPSSIADRPLSLYSQLFALSNIAVAQPLYEVLQGSPEFFIAHRADGLAIAMLIFCVSFLGASGLLALELLAGLLSKPLRRALHQLFCGLLTALGSLSALGQIDLGDTARLTLAVAIASVFVIAYRLSVSLRSVLGVASVVALVIPCLFVFRLSGVDIPASWQGSAASRSAASPASISAVLILFDQLPTAALIDADGAIDSRRYPNLARLAARSTWFRNATTVAQDTVTAAPAILTGRYPQDKLPPTVGRYPQNLFIHLMQSHWLNASELVSSLAPLERGEGARAPTRTAMLRDIAIVYLHILLPESLREDVPSIEDQVAHFGVPLVEASEVRGVGDRLAQVGRFVRAMKASSNSKKGRAGTFHFLHVALPHTPYIYDPKGTVYSKRWRIQGLSQGWSKWGANPEAPLLARQ